MFVFQKTLTKNITGITKMENKIQMYSTDVKMSISENRLQCTESKTSNTAEKLSRNSSTVVRIPKGVEMLKLSPEDRRFYINESIVRMKRHVENGKTFNE